MTDGEARAKVHALLFASGGGAACKTHTNDGQEMCDRLTAHLLAVDAAHGVEVERLRRDLDRAREDADREATMRARLDGAWRKQWDETVGKIARGEALFNPPVSKMETTPATPPGTPASPYLQGAPPPPDVLVSDVPDTVKGKPGRVLSSAPLSEPGTPASERAGTGPWVRVRGLTGSTAFEGGELVQRMEPDAFGRNYRNARGVTGLLLDDEVEDDNDEPRSAERAGTCETCDGSGVFPDGTLCGGTGQRKPGGTGCRCPLPRDTCPDCGWGSCVACATERERRGR